MSEKIKVSVVMPAYNEEKRIEACFHNVVESLKNYGQPFEIILEEDGSTDGTPEIIDKLASGHHFVKTLHFPKKMGKGFGVRKGLEVAQGELVVMIDSDMEYPPEKIPELLTNIDGNDIVVGARSIWKNMKEGKVRKVRALLSRLYIAMVNALFKVDLKGLPDLQSGFKAFRREVIEAIQPITSNGFEIDTEMLIKALRKGFKVRFIPITYTYKGESKVDVVSDPIKMFLSILGWKVNGKFRVGEEYPVYHRNEVEDEALRSDQAEIGYESKNPLVRMFFDKKIKAILRYALGEKGRRILDVGCGDGLILEKLRGEFVVGLDISTARLKRAKSRAKYGFLICGDAEHLPFKESSFDLVTCLDTLEHLPNPQDCVRDLEFSTAEEGAILVSIPDDRLLSLARFLTVKHPFCLRGHGHIHSFRPEEVVKLFRNYKLTSSCKVPTSLLPVTTLLYMRNDCHKSPE